MQQCRTARAYLCFSDFKPARGKPGPAADRLWSSAQFPGPHTSAVKVVSDDDISTPVSSDNTERTTPEPAQPQMTTARSDPRIFREARSVFLMVEGKNEKIFSLLIDKSLQPQFQSHQLPDLIGVIFLA